MSRSPLLLLVTAVLWVTACEKKTPSSPSGSGPDVLLLGEVGSLTGAQAAFGISTRQGIDLALQEANAAGGVKGRRLAVRVYDSQGRPEEAAQATTRLITQDKVLLILGEVASSNSMAMAEKAQAAGVPMISPSSTHPAVTQKGDYIFRVCFIDPFQGRVMAKFARENLKLERVAILQDTKSDYSIGLTEVFSREFTRLGGTILATESYSQGDTDFRPQLTALKQVRPQAVYVPGYYTDVGLIARQAREQGLTIPLLGSDGWDAEALYELGGDALEGSYFSNTYAQDDPQPQAQAFIARYKKTHGSAPDAAAVLGYEAARVAIDALGRARDLTGPSIRDAIASTRDFPGVTGAITLDEHRNAVKPAFILKISQGRAGFITTIAP